MENTELYYPFPGRASSLMIDDQGCTVHNLLNLFLFDNLGKFLETWCPVFCFSTIFSVNLSKVWPSLLHVKFSARNYSLSFFSHWLIERVAFFWPKIVLQCIFMSNGSLDTFLAPKNLQSIFMNLGTRWPCNKVTLSDFCGTSLDSAHV